MVFMLRRRAQRAVSKHARRLCETENYADGAPFSGYSASGV
jgi:hypothetical protein